MFKSWWWVLRYKRWGKRYTFVTTFLEYSFYLFDSIFPGIVLIDKLHNFEEGVCFPNNGYLGKRKKRFTYINGCCKQKLFHQKLETYRFRLPLKNWVDWIGASWSKMSQPQKCARGVGILKLGNLEPTYFLNVPFSCQPSTIFLIKWKLVELQGTLSPF